MRLALFFIVLVRLVYAMEFIRDAETEEYLCDVASPIFVAVGLKDEINLYLLKDNSINAFVYGGMNIFVHTGLIESSNTPNMLQGVMAHELGHITGAHLVKMQPQLSKALATYAIATLFGVGMLAADHSYSGTNAAIASAMLGRHIAERQFLSFSRTQEAEADRYALVYLKKSGISSEGMIELFKKLDAMQKTFIKDVDQYSVTHPLSSQRMDYFVENEFKGKTDNGILLHRHRLIQAKILAYSNNNSIYTNATEIMQNKVYNMYYLVHKNMLENNNMEALKIAKNLLEQGEKNPFFHEVTSTIYSNLRDIKNARYHLEKAVEFSNGNLLLKHELASFLIKNFSDEKSLSYAVFLLEGMKNTREASAVLYKNLQLAYQKLGMEDYYLISRIEEHVFFDDTEGDEKLHVKKMMNDLESLLQKKENYVITERLKRVKKIYESI